MRYIPFILAAAVIVALCSGCGDSTADIHNRDRENNTLAVNECIKRGGIPIFDSYRYSENREAQMTKCETPPNCYSR